MISCTSVRKDGIRRHYNLSTVFYRMLWGPHIHHGYWTGKESPREAQLQLTSKLADLADVQPADHVLDVGCGMGGSSIHLARDRGCQVTGITVSGLQRRWAECAALTQRVHNRVRFVCTDAESYQLPAESLDVVWSIECTEHLFEKAQFFERAADWLRPGGRVAICAWLAGQTCGDPVLEQQVHEVCEGFLCPSLGTSQDYVAWLQNAGLEVQTVEDWTPHVARTWEICQRRVRRSGIQRVAPWIDGDTVMFLNRFDTILNAYRSGAMQYGCFVARKPSI